tara:strand:- start:13140 stop:15971 length:2832 start_codon:yes stop_codon:yes gene_type:complete
MDYESGQRPRIFLIDAYAMIYRAFFAFIKRPLMNSQGENTSAAYGFANFLIEIREKYKPDYLAVVFDAGDSKREEIYPEYKATREKMPDELRDSLPHIRELVAGFNDSIVELEGYEADDVIGTLAVKAEKAGLEPVIVSGDKDLYQLVGPGIRLFNPGRGGRTGVAPNWVDETNVHEKFGIPAHQVIDYLALIGDSSDNIPGAPGIGPKTAVKLLEQFSNVEEILANVDKITAKRARNSLEQNREQVIMSKSLVTIMTDLDVELNLEEWKVVEPDSTSLHEFFSRMEFRRLTTRFASHKSAVDTDLEEGRIENGLSKNVGHSVSVQEEPGLYKGFTLVREVVELKAAIKKLGGADQVAIEVFTGFRDPHRADLAGIALAVNAAEVFYFSFGHVSGDPILEVGQEGVENLPSIKSNELKPLLDILADKNIKKIGIDLKSAKIVLDRLGVPLEGIFFDVGVAAYLLDPGSRSYDLEDLCMEWLDLALPGYETVVGSGKKKINFLEVDQQTAGEYGGRRQAAIFGLIQNMVPVIDRQGILGLFTELEIPLLKVLAEMELAGIAIDSDIFTKMSRTLSGDLVLLRDDIYKIAGSQFNLNSPKQLQKILFEDLDLPIIKKNKSGPSTDSSVLEELAMRGHDIARLMLEYRELEKMRSTYVDALPKLVNSRTGRIHTQFNQTVAATGRLSSSYPNLQNIPSRTEMGRSIRKAFVAEPGFIFYAADYSQIELRVLAHLSNDQSLVQAFKKGMDIHKQTAAVIFDVDYDLVTKEQRAQAKTINFATLYGQGSFSLANQLGVSREQAQSFIDDYFERFGDVSNFFGAQVQKAQQEGFVETLMGRRRYVPELKSKQWNMRQFGERVAQNSPIQGTAADLIKKAMIGIANELAVVQSETRMLLQVHDELLFEVPLAEEKALEALVSREMEAAISLRVPLIVQGGFGRTWYDTKV